MLPWEHSLDTQTRPGPMAGQVLASCTALAVEGTLPGAAQSPGPSGLGPIVLLWPGVTKWVYEDTGCSV